MFNHLTLVTINSSIFCKLQHTGEFRKKDGSYLTHWFFNEMVSSSHSEIRLYWSTFAGVLNSSIRCKDEAITIVPIEGIKLVDYLDEIVQNSLFKVITLSIRIIDTLCIVITKVMTRFLLIFQVKGVFRTRIFPSLCNFSILVNCFGIKFTC